MEAQGIEPWSEPASSAASTCVGHGLRVVPGRSMAHLPGTNPSGSHPPREGARGRPARLCYSMPSPQAGSVTEGCFSELGSAEAASAKSELAVESFQAVLPGTWTWARCHTFY